MSFTRHALFFKQDFEGGYRYLDRCGEFLVLAQEHYGLIPTGDQTPSGGMMEAPDIGVKVEANATFIRITQELPGNDVGVFVKYAEEISFLYRKLFSPIAIEKNNVALTTYLPFPTFEKACNASLKWGTNADSQENLGRTIGMPALSKATEYVYSSGSKRLTFKVRPVTFDNIRINRRNAGGQASKFQKQAIERQNKGAERMLKGDFLHALYLELELSEEYPPQNAFSNLFAEIIEKETILQQTAFK